MGCLHQDEEHHRQHEQRIGQHASQRAQDGEEELHRSIEIQAVPQDFAQKRDAKVRENPVCARLQGAELLLQRSYRSSELGDRRLNHVDKTQNDDDQSQQNHQRGQK